jgi:predicted nucleic acid-binding protein
MILTDTSVWVGHFRRPNPQLQELLTAEQVLIHPMILGELACGNLPQRSLTLRLLGKLPWGVVGRHTEVLQLVEDRKLWGSGISWIDAHLLASAMLSHGTLWTLDRRLRGAAGLLEVDDSLSD